jgi:hypothetical protein
MDNIDKNIYLKIGISMINNNINNNIYPINIIYDEKKLKELKDRYINNLSKQIKNIEIEIEKENNKYDEIELIEISNIDKCILNKKNCIFSLKNKEKIILEKLKYIEIIKNNILDNITKLEISLEKTKCYKLIAENK